MILDQVANNFRKVGHGCLFITGGNVLLDGQLGVPGGSSQSTRRGLLEVLTLLGTINRRKLPRRQKSPAVVAGARGATELSATPQTIRRRAFASYPPGPVPRAVAQVKFLTIIINGEGFRWDLSCSREAS